MALCWKGARRCIVRRRHGGEIAGSRFERRRRCLPCIAVQQRDGHQFGLPLPRRLGSPSGRVAWRFAADVGRLPKTASNAPRAQLIVRSQSCTRQLGIWLDQRGPFGPRRLELRRRGSPFAHADARPTRPFRQLSPARGAHRIGQSHRLEDVLFAQVTGRHVRLRRTIVRGTRTRHTRATLLGPRNA